MRNCGHLKEKEGDYGYFQSLKSHFQKAYALVEESSSLRGVSNKY